MLKNNQVNISKGPLNLADMKNYISKQDILNSQRCCNVMKTNRKKLRVDMNNKTDLIAH